MWNVTANMLRMVPGFTNNVCVAESNALKKSFDILTFFGRRAQSQRGESLQKPVAWLTLLQKKKEQELRPYKMSSGS